MTSLNNITSVNHLFVGEVVYKALKPGEQGYDLPDKYGLGGKNYTGTLLDYYHVGVVTKIHPLEIIHCTKPGPIVRDTKLGKWKYGGMLKDIDYGGNIPAEEVKEMVTLYGGNTNLPINMREARSTGSRILAEIPQGTMVELIGAGTEWSQIKYDGKTGYVLTKFIQSGGEGEHGGANDEMILINKAELEKIYDMIGDLLGMRG